MARRPNRTTYEVNRPETSVYSAYDRDGKLLYVGMTDEFHVRMAAHKSSSPWWPLAWTIRVERVASRDQAADRESYLIRTLHPLYNTVYNDRAIDHQGSAWHDCMYAVHGCTNLTQQAYCSVCWDQGYESHQPGNPLARTYWREKRSRLNH